MGTLSHWQDFDQYIFMFLTLKLGIFLYSKICICYIFIGKLNLEGGLSGPPPLFSLDLFKKIVTNHLSRGIVQLRFVLWVWGEVEHCLAENVFGPPFLNFQDSPLIFV